MPQLLHSLCFSSRYELHSLQIT